MKMKTYRKYLTDENVLVVIDLDDITCVMEQQVSQRPKTWQQDYLFDNGQTLVTRTNRQIWEEDIE